MQHTIFIADLHLDEKHQATTDYFLNFVATHAQGAEAIYILGDFFELWVGDDDQSNFYQLIKKCLKSLTDKKIAIYFVPGNRDFLIGNKFAKETGCKILPEFFVATLYGSNILLLHGDALCSLDYKHMQFRRLTKNRLLRLLFLSLPLTIRRKIGVKMRKQSRQQPVIPATHLGGVVPATVDTLLNHHSTTHMIHGHIHTARVFNFPLKNKMAERIVLGAWDLQGCALKWYANGKREMVFFK